MVADPRFFPRPGRAEDAHCSLSLAERDRRWNALRAEMRGRRGCLGIVAMRVDPRTKAAGMLEEYLRHFDIPIVAYLRSTQNYVNVAAAGLTIFDPPRARFRRDIEQWERMLAWLDE